MKKIVVTGANGQLGKCIRDAAADFPDLEFVFLSKNELDIENADSVSEFFRKNNFSHCINTAAYTNVEQAESDAKKSTCNKCRSGEKPGFNM
jgi:dTDP-4-dehydrorhamnose reductase